MTSSPANTLPDRSPSTGRRPLRKPAKDMQQRLDRQAALAFLNAVEVMDCSFDAWQAVAASFRDQRVPQPDVGSPAHAGCPFSGEA